MSSLMIKVGIMLSEQIDLTISRKIKSYQKNLLKNYIEHGNTKIGRMLHYYPFSKKGNDEADWCGWHNDHGVLTALTAAMYID